MKFKTMMFIMTMITGLIISILAFSMQIGNEELIKITTIGMIVSIATIIILNVQFSDKTPMTKYSRGNVE